MKHFLLFYDIASDYLERREAYRGQHLVYARAATMRGELVLGGALNDPVDGAVLLFQADGGKVVEEFAANDPYVVEGIVTGWRVREWTTVVGEAALTKV